MKTNEIRQAFLDFFSKHSHSVQPSSSIVPAGDPTLLFTNAGMVQFKDTFLGAQKRSYSRATTCQKCLRISGKHNDLENVGRTARHHTFFEMLGNFSFGDYFKKDAIVFAWEFLTVTLNLPKERLWVTVYDDDDEAEQLWVSETDCPKDRILRCGKEDNFWAMGETGPCGPCSEIHYYLGDDLANQSEEEFRSTDDLYLEIWNLVFMQFNRLPSGEMENLPKPSVDTGMGLERIAAVVQGALSNYDTDEFSSLIECTEKLSGKKYDGKDFSPRAEEQYEIDTAFRVIADHARACAVLLGDQITPSSDGRGYVLRRLIRRACKHGRTLGFDKPFLFEVSKRSIELLGDVYPELRENQKTILDTIKREEGKFIETLESGFSMLEKEIAKTKEQKSKTLPGSVAFLLHDTYGFPLDLTEDIVASKGFAVDKQGFFDAMEEQRERSRSARAEDTELILQKAVKASETKFVGYEFLEYESSIRGIFSKDGEIKKASSGEDVAIVVPETPFYAESGGQVGDTGSISTNSATLDVIDTKKGAGDTIVHICKVLEGEVESEQNVRLVVDEQRRALIRINHSATHLLHLALQEVLGEHVKQAGSRVSEKTLRFDFSHFEAVTQTELSEIERIVNEQIQANSKVTTDVLALEEAKERGAKALFGEKYSDVVRMVSIGGDSIELCGGTHAERSGDIGYCTIVSESSVASGVRRIEAVAGPSAIKQISALKEVVSSAGALLRSSQEDLNEKLEKLVEKNKELSRVNDQLSQKLSSQSTGSLSDEVETLNSGVKIIRSKLENASPKQLREVSDTLKQQIGSGCIALASEQDGKAIILAAVTQDLTDKYQAGSIIKELSKILGGKGGGRADLAQAGGGDPQHIGQALEKFKELLS